MAGALLFVWPIRPLPKTYPLKVPGRHVLVLLGQDLLAVMAALQPSGVRIPATSKGSWELWHSRLGHLGLATTQALAVISQCARGSGRWPVSLKHCV